MAFGTLEQVGEPPPPDPEAVQQAKNKAHRDKVESGFRALKEKRG